MTVLRQRIRGRAVDAADFAGDVCPNEACVHTLLGHEEFPAGLWCPTCETFCLGPVELRP